METRQISAQGTAPAEKPSADQKKLRAALSAWVRKTNRNGGSQ